MSFYNQILEVTLVFIVLLISTRVLGKKQLSELTYFNYITGITIGSLSDNIIANQGKFLQNIFSLFWWVLLTYISGIISLKWLKILIQ